MSTIDEIRKGYKINLKADPDSNPNVVICYNFDNFKVHIEKYKLEQKIENITKTINDGDIKDKKLFEEYKDKLKDIKMKIDDILKTVKEEYDISWKIIFDLRMASCNKIPEAEDIKKKIIASIIKEYIEKLIKAEKKLILYNDSLIELNDKLNLNF